MTTETSLTTGALGPMVPSVYEVVRTHAETADTTTIELQPVGAPIGTPVSGQFTMLWVPGVGEVPISLAGVNGDRLVHTIRAVGAVTTALCGLDVGAQLGVRGPFGRGWDLDVAHGRDVLVVAGGLGVVPLRPLIEELIAERHRFEEVDVLVGARSPEALVYAHDLEAWGKSVDVGVTVDASSPGWRGRVGAVTNLLGRTTTRPDREVAFVCGPEIMMRVVSAAVVERGTSPADVYVSLERNMHCGVGHCGRCQVGSLFLCQDGPVAPWDASQQLLAVAGR